MGSAESVRPASRCQIRKPAHLVTMSLAGCPSPVSLPYFLTAVVTVLMASFLLGTAETVLPPAGHPVIVLVEGTPARNVSVVDSWISRYSQRQRVAVGRWQADLNDPESSRGSTWFPQPAALFTHFRRVTRICRREWSPISPTWIRISPPIAAASTSSTATPPMPPHSPPE